MRIVDIARRYGTLLSHRVASLPVVILMPHSACNCRCVMCDIWKANKNRTEITAEDLRRHIDAFRKLNVKWVVLSGGEALMHSNLWQLCGLLKDFDVKISLLSTGVLLKQHAKGVVEFCDEVIVSLDGSREVHNHIRNIPRAYERLAEGVQAIKQEYNDFRITARCVVQKSNWADFPRIIDAARELGLDQISFLAADVSTTAFNRPGGWSEGEVSAVALEPHEVRDFAQLVEETITSNRNDFASGFIAESAEKLRNIVRYFSALTGSQEFPAVRCNAPWVSTVVEADGTVRPCFFHDALGNIHEASLASILNSDEAIDFRRNLDIETDEVCRKCVCTLNLSPARSV